MNKIIALSGTNGSGKDTVGQMLAERYKYLFISVTDLLREEARSRGLETNRENLRQISSEWRRDSGLGVLVDKAVAMYQSVKDKYPGGVTMASMRNPGEADRIHELGGLMVWVDGDPKVRYERIQSSQRGRDAEDNKTFQEFLSEEQVEMQHSGDETTLNLAGVKERSDIFIENNSSSIETFKDEAEMALTGK